MHFVLCPICAFSFCPLCPPCLLSTVHLVFCLLSTLSSVYCPPCLLSPVHLVFCLLSILSSSSVHLIICDCASCILPIVQYAYCNLPTMCILISSPLRVSCTSGCILNSADWASSLVLLCDLFYAVCKSFIQRTVRILYSADRVHPVFFLLSILYLPTV